MGSPTPLEQVRLTSAIDILHRLGDVGDTSEKLLKSLLPHCKAEQLEHIEASTQGRDLTPITVELWRQHYGSLFGKECDDVMAAEERMAAGWRSFPWRRMFKTKTRLEAELATQGVDSLKELYQNANKLEDTRKVHLIDTSPPGGNKRAKATTILGRAGVSSKKPATGGILSKACLLINT